MGDGPNCGIGDSTTTITKPSAVYTKVSPYREWILSIVQEPTPSPVIDINMAGGPGSDTTSPSISPSSNEIEDVAVADLDPSSFSWFTSTTNTSAITTTTAAQTNCGGSLIDPRYVLMAAHCSPNDNIYLNLASSSSPSPSPSGVVREVEIELAIRHPEWNPQTYENDIMVLRLVTPIDNIQPISRYVGIDLDPVLAFIGSSNNSSDSDTNSDNDEDNSWLLTTTTIKIQPMKRCPEMISSQTQFCAASDDNVCIEKNSGPVIQLTDLKQVGLLSFFTAIPTGATETEENKKCNGGQRAIYTIISAYTGWILSVIHQKDSRSRSHDGAALRRGRHSIEASKFWE